MENSTVKHVVIVNGEVSECPKHEGESWADALDRVIAAMAPDRTVTGVLLNGAQASRNDLESLSTEAFTIEVMSASVPELFREVLSDLVLHLDSLMVVFQEIGNNLRRGNLSAVFASSGKTGESGGVYMQGLEGIVAAQVLVEEVGRIERQSGQDSFRLSFIEEQDRIEAVLDGMLKSQESQDWVLLADLVEYEILPILQRGRAKSFRRLESVLASDRKDGLVVA